MIFLILLFADLASEAVDIPGWLWFLIVLFEGIGIKLIYSRSY